MSQSLSPYQILGLPSQASFVEVKAAYRALAQRWHPDKFMDRGEKVQAEAKLKLINGAYAQLKDRLKDQLKDPPKPPIANAAAAPNTAATRSPTTAHANPSDQQAALDQIWLRVAQNAKARLRSRADTLYQEAQALAKAERYREATDALDQAIRLCAEHLEARQYRGRLYEKRGFALLAQRDFAKVRALKKQAKPTVNPMATPR